MEPFALHLDDQRQVVAEVHSTDPTGVVADVDLAPHRRDGTALEDLDEP